MENHWYRHDEGITNICFEFTKRVNSLILLLTLSNCFNFYNFGFVKNKMKQNETKPNQTKPNEMIET